jgi:hypothetical protein
MRVATKSWIGGACAAVLVACATTTVDGTWTRPGFGGTTVIGPVLVVGVARDETLRRLFEEAVVARLGTQGLKAIPSYELVPVALERESPERLAAAARQAGARHMLSTAVIGHETEVSVTQDPMWIGGMGGYRGWYGGYWGMAYPMRTDVRTYKIYVAQTSLTDVGSDRIDWAARTRTTQPSNIEREVAAFADLIAKEMTKAGLLPPPKQ